MKENYRTIFDRVFTVITGFSVVLLVAVLAIVLGPMLWRGVGAIVFKGTIEFRKMQLAEFEHGNENKVKAQIAETEAVRARVYEIINKFKSGIDPESLSDRARKIHRDFGAELRYKGVARDEYTRLRSITRYIRNKLETAFNSLDKAEIDENIKYVLQYKDDENFKNTVAEDFFKLATDFRDAVADIDLKKRQEYAKDLAEVEGILFRSGDKPGLLGSRPDEHTPALAMYRYGATRWDQAQDLLHKLLWREEWVEQKSGKSLVRVETSRAERFAGTKLKPLFGYVEDNLEEMLLPEQTFYWRYFFDDSIPGHYFGGIGPEILGTLLLTILSMVFVVPLGVISAAYLTECAGESAVIRIIRMCINTLAGVPSIVFGLFG
ncbi:MAG: hypothetical protein PVJ60_08375, partial [Phycisphaerales bacterium]